MERFNVQIGDLDQSSQREGYRWRGARGLGNRLGGKLMGGAVFDLDAGELSFPYHFHHGVEEWLYVISGAPVARTPAGERTMKPGDLVAFPSGADGAHTVRGPGRILILSAGSSVAMSVYPDSDKLAPRPPDERDRLNFRRSDAVDYWEGE